MKEVDNIETLSEEWMCKQGAEDQLNGTEQSHKCFVDNLFEEARKIGAICMPPAKVNKQADIIIKLWKNGFTVNDGNLRSYTDVANQQFLDSIKKGELPFELQKNFDEEEVDVKVEDKKDEVYMSRKPVFHPFSGHGYRLGSATPRIISKGRNDHGDIQKRALPSVPLSDSEPITNVQIWLADGERIVQKFNVSHRISHVRDFIMQYQGVEGSVPFTLTTSLPFLELQDETLSLEEANLQNAVIVQRRQKTTEPFQSFS
ncbi:UBX domain-containing protein 2A isoform X1 [Alligator mississippiensis]|nr:UBX domain-containing protein 2A isoform X1 [Alligator mississippiensis]XP_019336931.1 UBX domain-containing protein 2A isoform X1 [Alligator mississippiensis]XP_019336934.1 UBX domain-containing protein 2A isoform X1 [Alligator mississippiensis]XP_059585202.1 UBX domain-containing protein 2A isoform X1 [Alligator mississippiensis]XP_059585205.1 UBX domain-containing protein 2A isoform X1 [Alligator mississippiensis]